MDELVVEDGGVFGGGEVAAVMPQSRMVSATRQIKARTPVSRSGVPIWPWRYLLATMLVAVMDQSTGDSTSFCSKMVLPLKSWMTASRRSHCTSEYGDTSALVKKRSQRTPPRFCGAFCVEEVFVGALPCLRADSVVVVFWAMVFVKTSQELDARGSAGCAALKSVRHETVQQNRCYGRGISGTPAGARGRRLRPCSSYAPRIFLARKWTAWKAKVALSVGRVKRSPQDIVFRL